MDTATIDLKAEQAKTLETPRRPYGPLYVIEAARFS